MAAGNEVSGAIVASGVAQSVLPANPYRKGLAIQNRSTATMVMRGNGENPTAVDGLEIPARSLLILPTVLVSQNPIFLYSDAAGSTYAIVEGVDDVWASAPGGIFSLDGPSGIDTSVFVDKVSAQDIGGQKSFVMPPLLDTGAVQLALDNSQAFATTKTLQSAIRAQAILLTPQMPLFAALKTSGVPGDGTGDDYLVLQALGDFSALHSLGFRVPAGLYLTSRPITFRQPSTALGSGPLDRNYYNLPPVSWEFDQGCIIRATAPMQSVLTFGGADADFSQYIHNGLIIGGVVDGNFLATVCVTAPFFNTLFIKNQQTRNYLLRGWEMGSLAAPGGRASAGSCHEGCTTWRDTERFRANISAITRGANPTMTSAAHGYPVGSYRVLAIDGIPEANNIYFDTLITDANSFQLFDCDSTNWTFSAANSPRAYLTFPSMRIPRFVTGVTLGNPTIITVATPHRFPANDKVFIADIGNMPQLDGVFTVTPITGQPLQFSIPVDSTNYPAYASAVSIGCALEWVNPDTVETGVYFMNATDADDINCEFVGNRICFRSNPATCGYDGAHVKPHHYNYNEQGEIFAAYDVGGDNKFDTVQVDGPFRYIIQCRNGRNRGTLCNTDYTGGQGWDRYASPIRLENGAEFKADLCAWKGVQYRLASDCSGNIGGYTCSNMSYLNVYNAFVSRSANAPVARCRFTPGATPTILEAQNVASVTRNGAGDYTLNFVNPVATSGEALFQPVSSGAGGLIQATELLSTSIYNRRVQTYYNGSLTDAAAVSAIVYGPYMPPNGVGTAP